MHRLSVGQLGLAAWVASLVLVLLPFTQADAQTRNRPPTISGTPPTTVNVGSVYSFTPRASDPEGARLRFYITNKPYWASFSSSTGTLQGRPRYAGRWGNIQIRVSDGRNFVSLPAFSITASTASSNTAPTISGTPPTSASVGTLYTFRPSASDANGDPLTFSIANRPAWATFNTSTGQLSGTPTASHAGTYSNVTISVSDGRASASLAPFSITVREPSRGSATLSWTAPTRNTDGSALTNLAGFRIYYGTSATQLHQTIQISNPSVSRYVIEDLAPSTYYFAVRAYTSNGLESANSATVSKSVQ